MRINFGGSLSNALGFRMACEQTVTIMKKSSLYGPLLRKFPV
jgi:hypothetical protein